MHLEILPPARPDDARRRWSPTSSRACCEVLRLVEEAVEDWQKMITRAEETVALLDDPSQIGGRTEEAGTGPRAARAG